MRDTSQTGRIGEAAIVSHFIKSGYEVFHPLFGNTSCDLIVQKDGVLYRVECKASNLLEASGSCTVGLRSTRLGVNKKFDSTKSDLLACYLQPFDQVVVLESKSYEGRSNITLKKV